MKNKKIKEMFDYAKKVGATDWDVIKMPEFYAELVKEPKKHKESK